MNIKGFTAVLALSLASTFAHATAITGSIGMGGNGTYNVSTGAFTAGAPTTSGSASNAYVNAADSVATDSLSNFTMFNGGEFYDFNTSNVGLGETVFTTTENGQTLSFLLTSVGSSGTNAAGPGFMGTGILSETGFDSTAASFTLNTNANAGTVVTFNTTAATPEPSSLFLLGTGAITAAGMVRRRFMATIAS